MIFSLKAIGRILLMGLCLAPGPLVAISAEAPHLRDKGTTRQLIVDDKPFLVLGGELANSSASDLSYLQAQWPTLKSVGLNTIIAPVEWDQVEPQQGRFDFTVLDGMIRQARQNKVKIVVLWFGVWKNSMSTYVPAWVKRDYATYAKAQDDKGQPQDILSPFDPDTLKADSAAYAAMLGHLKKIDTDHTVIMVQVENEIGMLPVVRDYSPQAQAAWNGPVPSLLIRYLKAHQTGLHPYVRRLWEAKGQKDAGAWPEVFGDSIEAQEVFQAWYFAVFANEVARAGKAQYPLPMYVNAALIRPGKKPGQYPSAGPLPHLFDVWKAAGPDIDILAIDLYFPNFHEWADQFKRPDNPFFMPESNQAGKPEAGANAFYAIGQLDSISFSPFAIDEITPDNSANLTQAYDVLKQLSPLILEAQGTGRMRGFKPRVSFDGVVDETPQSFTLGGYRFTVSFIDPWKPKDKQNIAANGGLIIQTGPEAFVVAGTGIVVTFEDAGADKMAVGIEQAVEGTYQNGIWKPGRWLNGDEIHQGRHVKINGFGIQQLKLYKYK
jgi:beta-galactosidase GanA